jgi:site-specific recombinase XerD
MPRLKPEAVARPNGWTETVDQFCTYLISRERSPHTVRCYRSDLGLLSAWYRTEYQDEPELSTITAVELRTWKSWMIGAKQAPQTVNRRLAAIATMLDWAQSHEWCQPIQAPESLSQQPRPPRWLDRKEANALVRAVDHGEVLRDMALVRLLLYAGLRIAEASALNWDDLEVGPRGGHVTVTGKGVRQRTIDLNKEVRPHLIRLPLSGPTGPVFVGREGRLKPKRLGEIITEYGRLAQIGDLTAHMLRHTFAHDLAVKGIPIQTIAKLLGHKSVVTTQIYVEPGRDEMRAAVESLAGDDPDQAARPPRTRKDRR